MAFIRNHAFGRHNHRCTSASMEHYRGPGKHHEQEDRRVVDQEEQDLSKQQQQQQRQYPSTRLSSILFLTLDEIQNMDEFLTNIWTAEEGNNSNLSALLTSGGGGSCDDPTGIGPTNISNGGTPASLPPLGNQGSLSLTAPLCRKTVDELWTEIHRKEEQQQLPQPQPQLSSLEQQYAAGSEGAARQPTLGEMTLDDFLIKARVVREGGSYDPCSTTNSPSLPKHQFSGFSLGMEGYADHHQNTVSNGGYRLLGTSLQPGAVVDGGYYNGNEKIGDGFGGVGSPAVSPVSSDRFGGGRVDNTEGLWGVDMAATRSGGRKRVLDGPVEKVLERRKRRMIKNRESAERSRARKQAYTVELEAKLNHLREENARIREEQKRVAAKRRQMILDSMTERARTNPGRRSKTLRRCNSSLW